jgi:hypothetical protein
MDWLIKVVVVWLSFDIVLLSTCWYASLIIKQFWPEWWQRRVITIDPEPDVKNF